MSDIHQTVLLQEAVENLVKRTDGIYVDGTFGRGGHSALILDKLSTQGKLIAVDKDPQAISFGQKRFPNESRIVFENNSFADLLSLVKSQNLLGKIDGILLDLGVSSPQLDNGERGFSFLQDGPLDMRMDNHQGLTAAQWLIQVEEKELARVIKTYGEEKFARRIAKAIIQAQRQKPIERTLELAKIIANANPAWEKHKHPATRTFQAIRIHINNELKDLEALLNESIEILAVGGRLVIISFHSLEDRIVKRFIRHMEHREDIPRHLPLRQDQIDLRLRSVGKAMKVGELEKGSNIRARSAVMRVAEKIK